jgi:A/G-specific adenine glycosylase
MSGLEGSNSLSTLSLQVPEDRQRRIARDLIAWYRVHKRDLPWRGASPYAVWVSEIMLQQTQVATVIPYFLRFMERFPTVEALAAAPIDDVLRQWAGLGYYARARNLHRAAQVVVEQHDGRLPDTAEAIERLPGIGRYTAGAVLSIAYNVRRPLVDANVIRVLSRLFGVPGDPKSGANQAALWSLAERLVPEEAPGDFNQGLMELGALICRPDDPLCERCPLLAECVAGNSPDPTRFPECPPGRTTVRVAHSSAIVMRAERSPRAAQESSPPASQGSSPPASLEAQRHRGGGEAETGGEAMSQLSPAVGSEHQALLVRRPPHGLWGGLWEFPRVVCEKRESAEAAAVRAAREVVGVAVTIVGRVGVVKHAVTHHAITLTAFLCSVEPPGQEPSPLGCAEVRWVALGELDRYALSAPQALLRDLLLT